jgi:hypothetical protein
MKSVVEALLVICLLYLGSELVLETLQNPVSRVPVSHDVAGSCPAQSLQLVYAS